MWTLDEGLEFLRLINSRIQNANYHCGIIGSVIINGHSNNDLDIAILPYEGPVRYANIYSLQSYLNEIDAHELRSDEYGTSYLKFTIYKYEINNKKVDFFVY